MPVQPLTDEDIQAAVKALEAAGGNRTKAAAKLKITRTSLNRRLEKAKIPAAKSSKGRTLTDFRGAHDKAYIIPQRIRKALSDLGESWVYESEFTALAQLTPVDLHAFRDEFQEHVVEVRHDGRRRVVWAGTKGFATRLREMVR